MHSTILAGNFGKKTGSSRDDLLGSIDPDSSFNLLGAGVDTELSNGNMVGIRNRDSDPWLTTAGRP